jgi:hypothetical protein
MGPWNRGHNTAWMALMKDIFPSRFLFLSISLLLHQQGKPWVMQITPRKPYPFGSVFVPRF